MKTNQYPSRWVASVRLQLNPIVGFGFAEVAKIIPLLRRVGFTWLYLSPVAKSQSGSNHGYDTKNALELDVERGGKDFFESMLAAAQANNMRVLWDYTHHQARGDGNPLWNGQMPISRETAFDIDPVTGENRGFWQHRHLAGMRVEDPAVLAHTLRMMKKYARGGVVGGIRVDATDMLTDPHGFAAALVRTTKSIQGGKFLKLAETIVPPNHFLFEGFDGTVGMESLADLSQVFISEAGRVALIEQWNELAGTAASFDAIQAECSKVHARMTFEVEARRIHREFNKLSINLDDIYHALGSFTSRTHIDAKRGRVSDDDKAKIRAAKLTRSLATALLNPTPETAAAIAHLEQAVVGTCGCGFTAAAFRYGAIIGLNDAGNNPGHQAISVDELHKRHAFRACHMGSTLNTRTTHDTMISGDFRDNLKALTFVTTEWRELVDRWFEQNQAHKVNGAPSRKEEYYLYQVLLGAGFVSADRLNPFIEKWLREAGVNTGWLDHDFQDGDGRKWHKRDEQYETGVKDFVQALRADDRFVASLNEFRNTVRRLGTQLTLSQLLITLTSPGMGDIYQGDLLWLYLLIDPDNRVAADWDSVNAHLERFEAGELPTFETVKLWVVWKTLQVRARNERAFAGKSYRPIEAGADVCAYARGRSVQVFAPVRPGAKVSAKVPAGWQNVFAQLEETKIELDGVAVPVSLALFERVK